jgi:F-type H+-transporting ATPase subunit epsilon
MAEAFQIDIVSPERLVVSTSAQSVVVPGTEGYLTVMAQHAPLMTTLRAGFITVVGADGRNEVFYVRGGFADVTPSGLTILAEDALPAAEFDHDALQVRIREAQEELARAQTPEERNFAQEMVNGLLNLALEAGQLQGGHIH